MKNPTLTVASLSIAISLFTSGVTQNAFAAEIVEGPMSVNINGQLQLHAAIEGVDDPHESDDRLFLFLRQARLSVDGHYGDTKYEVEWMLGGEEVPERNSVMSLLDGYVDTPWNDTIRIKLGQFKVPYSRERLLDSGDSFNVNRSVGNNFFNIGRDVGAAIYTESEESLLSGALGVFTGGGINIPERYLPEDIGIPMFVGRVGINDGLDQGVFNPVNAETARRNSGFAAYLNAMYNEDSRVGHSTPLNVKTFDKSLILQSSWNPYVNARGQKSTYYQVGGDVAWEGPLSEEVSLLLTAEAHFSHLGNDEGDIDNYGGLVGSYVITDEWRFGLRYALVEPDSEMAYTEKDPDTGKETLFQITDEAIQEITASAVYFLPETGFKFLAELSYQIDVPVAIEAGHGVYNTMRQSDQVSNAASGGIELQDNYLASLIVQYNF